MENIQFIIGFYMSLDLNEIRQQITQIDRSLLKLLSNQCLAFVDVVRSRNYTESIA